VLVGSNRHHLGDVYRHAIYLAEGSINMITFSSHGQSNTTILAFPHAGGIASIYTHIASQFQDFNLHAFDLPGHLLTKGKLFDDLQCLCEFLLMHIPPSFLLTNKLVLMGTSFGAYISCTLASLLVSKKYRAPQLILFAALPPNCLPSFPNLDLLPISELMAILSPTMSIEKLTSAAAAALAHFEKALRADLKMFKNFSFPVNIADCKTMVIGGLDDTLIKSYQFYEWIEYYREVSIDFVPGAHLFIENTNSNLRKLLNAHHFF